MQNLATQYTQSVQNDDVSAFHESFETSLYLLSYAHFASLQ